jgi:hypothetical protein
LHTPSESTPFEGEAVLLSSKTGVPCLTKLAAFENLRARRLSVIIDTMRLGASVSHGEVRSDVDSKYGVYDPHNLRLTIEIGGQ